MAKPTDKERVGAWLKRVNSGSKVVQDWAEEFDCDILEQFYYGHQWPNDDADFDRRKYVINLHFPAINISKPSMLFSTPKYKVTPRPNRINDPLSDVETRAKLQEVTLNSYVSDPKIGFEMETGLALLDSQFRYGVVYVGYNADFVENPNAGKPALNDKGEALLDGDSQPVAQPDVTINSEQLFLKWIPASHFVMAENAPNRLQNADWSGFWEWHRIDDLQANKNYKNTSGLKATGKLRGDETATETAMSDGEKAPAGMVKTYFIWDHRKKTRMVFVAGGEKFLKEESFSFVPFAVLKFNERLGKFLPLPESYNWVHPQRELNDTREMQRLHRKRAVRRYRRRDSVEESEFNKLVDAEDMTCIVTANETDITPIPDAPLDAAVARNIPQSQDDFTRVSGVSGEAQEVAQSETATQANLIALASKTRDSAKRLVVAKWLSEIGRIMLLTLVEKMALPFWIQQNIDPASPLAAQEAQEIAEIWKTIEREELGDIDNDISVEISSLSPVSQSQERDELLAFLGILKDPILGGVISQSPYLLRKVAGSFNIHDERELSEISKAMEAAVMMQVMMQMQAGGGSKGPGGGMGPGPTPTNQQTQGQLAEQLPVEVGQR